MEACENYNNYIMEVCENNRCNVYGSHKLP
jgi:hypothetical protein